MPGSEVCSISEYIRLETTMTENAFFLLYARVKRRIRTSQVEINVNELEQ